MVSLAVEQMWWNELGSAMVITSYDSATGVFGGKYYSKVGEAENWYVLTGRNDTAGTTLGWTVNWKNSSHNAHSVTTWSGQFQLPPDGKPALTTTWLLTAQTNPEDNWESTMVGFDRFYLTEPPYEIKERAKLHCRRSHPKEA
ncbi:Streptavidin-V2 [Geodia barretti]|uniref:Streptavidin-V2 n=1 Tax=Geodia barretti TaxID=519541 RepID=A0AA35RT70_GEOBA|nr:Streptavidin-V2 [Geodia barretti]